MPLMFLMVPPSSMKHTSGLLLLAALTETHPTHDWMASVAVDDPH